MKNCLFILLIFLTTSAFAQETEQFYQTSNGEYAFKLDGNTCILYELSRYGNTVYRQWEIYPTYSTKSQLDSLGILFSNGQYAISYDSKYFRVCDLKNGKVKDRRTYVAKKLTDPSKVYEAINHSYWNTLYRETMDHTYPLFNYHYHYEGHSIWDSLPFKQAIPEEFNVLANQHNQLLKDSLALTNQQLISLNDSIEKNMNILTLGELKSNLLSRPLHVYLYDEYQDEMLESVAERRPDLYFDLVEALPTEKEYLFGQVYSHDAVRSLKRYRTDAPVKKEFLKYRRKERALAGLITTAVVFLDTAVIGGVVTGFVYLFRK